MGQQSAALPLLVLVLVPLLAVLPLLLLVLALLLLLVLVLVLLVLLLTPHLTGAAGQWRCECPAKTKPSQRGGSALGQQQRKRAATRGHSLVLAQDQGATRAGRLVALA